MLEKRNKDKDLEKDLTNLMHSNNNKCRSCYEVAWPPYRYYFARKKTTKTGRFKAIILG